MRLSEKIKAYRAAQAKLEAKRTALRAVTYYGAGDYSKQAAILEQLTAAIDRTICTLSYLYQKRDALQAAQRLMVEEQGLTHCDLPWCHRAATAKWVRTAKQIKDSTRKHKGVALRMEPESIRCSVHVPAWREGVYSPLVGFVKATSPVKVAS